MDPKWWEIIFKKFFGGSDYKPQETFTHRWARPLHCPVMPDGSTAHQFLYDETGRCLCGEKSVK